MTADAILLVGYYGSGNAGDELLLGTLVERIRTHAPNIPLIATRAGPGALPEGVESVPLHDAYAITSAVGRSKLVVMGGGGLLQDKGRADPWQVLHDPCAGVAAYLRPVMVGRWYGRRTLMIGNGVGPIRTASGQALLRAATLHLDAMTVRDERSAELLRAHGAQEVSVGADLVWARPATHSEGPNRIVVNLRETIAGLPESVVQTTALALDRVSERHGCPVAFLPFQVGGGYGDKEPFTRLKSAMRQPLEWLEPTSPEALFEAYAGARLSVGMRFHAAIAATRAGVAHVALAYDPKVSGVMAQLGVSERCFELDALEGLEQGLERALDAGAPDAAPLREGAERCLAPLLDALHAPSLDVPVRLEELEPLSRNLQRAFELYGRAPLAGMVRDLGNQVRGLQKENEELRRRTSPRAWLGRLKKQLRRGGA